MPSILGIAGSLRQGSYNRSLLKAAIELAPEGMRIDVGPIDDVPLYNGDIEEKDGIPAAVQALKAASAAADGLLLVTPEYNNSIPGVFKNVIDWMSRPPKDMQRVFGGKPVAILGASPSGFGTVLSQEAWLQVLRSLTMQPWFGGSLMVSRASSKFEDGRLTDPDSRKILGEFLAGYAKFLSDGR